MVEWEADDAIGAAAKRFAADPRVERIVICTPDKDMAQLVVGDRIVLWDRRRDITYDEPAVRTKWGVEPESVPDRLALVGDSSDGFPGLPGWGDKAAAAVLAKYRHLEASRPGVRLGGPRVCAARSASPRPSATGWTRRSCIAIWPRSAPSEDGVDIPQQDPEELHWQGADRETWEAFCDNGASIVCARARTAGVEGVRAAERGRLACQAQQLRVVPRRGGDHADRLASSGRGRTTGRPSCR